MSDAPSMIDAAGLIVKKAKNLGFDDCRICDASPPDATNAQALEAWLSQGMNGTMGWFGRSKEARLDLRTRFPWAKSVVVLRINYPTHRHDLPEGSLLNAVARYAQGFDYHDILRARLEKLQTYLRRFDDGRGNTGCEALWYQDTGPILEHVYAQRAGIGWTGKHTLTLNANEGSYFFLAEIITSLDLPADEAAQHHCGTCTACIDACPTTAITAPYVLDARKCISYLTIEHHGGIEPGLRPHLKHWAFGCDICQEVCPFNERAIRGGTLRRADDEWRTPQLEGLMLSDVLMLRDARLLEMLKGTPLERTGPERLKRNVALLAGAEKRLDCFKGLVHCITHPEESVRQACIWALSRYARTPRYGDARQALSTHQKRESEESMRDLLTEALAYLHQEASS